MCPRSPPWAPLPRGLEIRHQIPHRTLMLKKGNQISLAGGQPGQGAGGQEGTRVGKVMGEFMPPTPLLPLPLQSPVSTPGNKTISSFLFCGLYRACVRVSVCERERWGVEGHYMGAGWGDSRPGSGLGEMCQVRGQGPGLGKKEAECIGEKE